MRHPVPGEDFLLSLRHHTSQLADKAAALRGAATGLPARLAVLHRRQAAVLEAELLRLGVPRAVLDHAAPAGGAMTAATSGATETTARSTTTTTSSRGATATASATAGSGGPTPPTPPASAPPGLAAAEVLDLGPGAMSSLATVSSTARPLVGSLLAQRAAAAALLGEPYPWPDQTWKEPSLAASFLDSTRAAVYAFEVVAAQSLDGAQGTLAKGTLRDLQSRALVQETLAGASAGPPALAYPLPFPVTTPGQARRLAVSAVTQLRAAVAGDLGSAGSDAGPLGAVVQWLADTEVLASRWGVALAPFPGLR